MISLFRNREFSCLIGAQFLAALNDNFLKQLFLLMVVHSALIGEGTVDYQLQGAGTAVFAIPFLLFSALAGNLSDRRRKGTIIRWTKLIELVVAGVATWGLFVDNLGILLLALLLLSTQSCFFSPAKYGILPEILPRERLSAGNGILQLTTYVAILLGTASAGITLTLFVSGRVVSGYLMIGVAIVGWLFSLGVDGESSRDPGRGLFEFPLGQLARGLNRIIRKSSLAVAVMNFVFVWFLGTLLMVNLNVFGMKTLALNRMWTSLLNVFLAVGLGLGSYLAGWLSGDGIRPDFVPIGGLFLGASLLVLQFWAGAFVPNVLLIFAVGLGGGFYLVPVQTLTQDLPDDQHRGEVLGLLNFLTYAGVLVASAGYVVLVGYWGFDASAIMGTLGVVAIVISASLYALQSEYRFPGSSVE